APGAESVKGAWAGVCQQGPGHGTERPKNMRWIIDDEVIWFDAGRKMIQVSGGKELKDLSDKPVIGGNGPIPGKFGGVSKGLRMTYHVDATRTPNQVDLQGLKKASYI